jgi:glycosyltransferase involved in cell wall biosynthesis
MPKFTLAIPTYRRFAMLDQHLQRYIDNPDISEIVISDDVSDDFKLLSRKYGKVEKLKLFTNTVNLGASKNKMMAVERSSSDYVLLLDSDNHIDNANLKHLFQIQVEPNTVVCPSHAMPDPGLNYSVLPDYINHLQFDLDNKYRCFANNGNYLVPRKEYLLAANKVKESKIDPGPYDVVFINYYMGQLGMLFNNDKAFKYYHLVHDGLWRTTHEKYDHWFTQFGASITAEYNKICNIFDDAKWRPSCAMVYPPFKNGLYLEEYFYRFYQLNKARFPSWCSYINILWTNIYCNGLFQGKPYSQLELQKYIDTTFPENKGTSQDNCKNDHHAATDTKDPNKSQIKYFTIVQYDDGVLRKLPAGTQIFSAGGVGTVPLPLIYQDLSARFNNVTKIAFEDKKYLCSFVGGFTHPLRTRMRNVLSGNPKILIHDRKSPEEFIEITRQSKFVLAPRGYGRSSFRFFEAYQLGSIPIYMYDDINWLPFQDIIDYSKVAIIIKEDQLSQLTDRILSITPEQYRGFLIEYNKIAHLFTMEGMCEQILKILKQQ